MPIICTPLPAEIMTACQAYLASSHTSVQPKRGWVSRQLKNPIITTKPQPVSLHVSSGVRFVFSNPKLQCRLHTMTLNLVSGQLSQLKKKKSIEVHLNFSSTQETFPQGPLLEWCKGTYTRTAALKGKTNRLFIYITVFDF